MSYCNLHCHTDFSVFDGFAKLSELVSRAKELNYPALAMTDHGTTTGLVAFYKECRAQGIKPILGYEAYLTTNVNLKEGKLYHILVLAKNLTGYRNLLKLATYGTQNFYRKPRIDLEKLIELKEGLIVSTACIAGIFSHPEYADMVERLYEAYREDFYLEIGTNSLEEQKAHNELVLSLWRDYKSKIKVVATIDSHYVRKEDATFHRLWKRLGEDSTYYTTDDYYLMEEQEVRNRLSYLPEDFVEESINTTIEIADKCNVEIPFGEQHFPVFPVEDALARIKELCNEGWNKLHISKKKNAKEYIKQANLEFEVLNKANYLNYMLIIHDIENWTRKNFPEHKMPVGVGRGSVGGSLVAYLIGLTDIDPIEYNLVFERFCNLERISVADIDVDCPTSIRQQIIEYVKEKYGLVYQIRTANYVGEKAALQRAGQSLKVAPYEVDKISKNMNSLEKLPNSDLKTLAIKFVGHLQNYGVHASAVVVFPEDPNNWIAIEKSGDNLVAAIDDYHSLEDQGMMKLDILGLETLDIINHTLHNIENRTGEIINIKDIKVDDQETAAMLNKGWTHGCFQIESNTMTKIIKGIGVKNVNDLVHTVALGRPGPLDAGMADTFINRRAGKEPIEYLHPDLEPILKDSVGVIIYQEQIMQIARNLCGYSYGEADVLRAIIGKKKVDKMPKAIEGFIKRGIANGYNKEMLTALTDQIVTFASYGFNKAHSAEYGYTAWITAWLKTHYPSDFIAALLTSWAGDKDKLINYVLHARELGVEILPPSITYSKKDCVSVSERQVRIGFGCIAGVGNSEVPNYEDDFVGFMQNYCKLNKTLLKNLVKSGCFSGDRMNMLREIEWFKDARKSKGDMETYIPRTEIKIQEYEDMEKEAIRFSFNDKLEQYDLSRTNGSTLIGVEVVSVKPYKTKKGKPMAFIKARDREHLLELVVFNDSFFEIEPGEVYLMKVSDTIIQDFCHARPKIV